MLALCHARCRLLRRHLQGVGGRVEERIEEESVEESFDEHSEEESMEVLEW